MNNYNPITARVIFFVILIVLFVIFNPKNGLYIRYKKTKKVTEKIAIEDILKLLYHQPKSTKKAILQELDFSNHLLQESIDTLIKKQFIQRVGKVVSLTE